MSNDKPNVVIPNDRIRRNNDLRSPISCEETDQKKQAKQIGDVKASNETEMVLLRKVTFLDILI
jgi:hypothetical protein